PFTEKRLAVRVRPRYMPRNSSLHLDPDTVYIKCLVPLDDYELITDADFGVEVDYREIDERSDYIVPRITTQVPGVEIVEFSPKRMQYLIVSKE
ncbi:MAG: hypothetical protein AAF570_18835, partial [Bacteroidota bacterium]